MCVILQCIDGFSKAKKSSVTYNLMCVLYLYSNHPGSSLSRVGVPGVESLEGGCIRGRVSRGWVYQGSSLWRVGVPGVESLEGGCIRGRVSGGWVYQGSSLWRVGVSGVESLEGGCTLAHD